MHYRLTASAGRGPDNGPLFSGERSPNPRPKKGAPFEEVGFSILELDRAGISESRAHALGIRVDGTRHSALRHNVDQLKGIAG
jgi:hypothetical protein